MCVEVRGQLVSVSYLLPPFHYVGPEFGSKHLYTLSPLDGPFMQLFSGLFLNLVPQPLLELSLICLHATAD